MTQLYFVLASATLGILIGAFYGYLLAPALRPKYPFALLIAGWAFIAVLFIINLLMNTGFTDPSFHVSRAALWLVMCSSIPIGRLMRHEFELWRTRRFHRNTEKGS